MLPFDEFLKIVSDDDDILLNVFEDNVRDFQGDNNDVNGGIALTLNSEDSEIFSVLNNGVTIVASSISPTGDQFTISDYQIVNGCQTSNVLYNNRKGSNITKVSVPIKLIATTDEEVKTEIKRISEMYGVTEDDVINMIGGEEVIKADLKMRKAIDIIKEN